MADGLFTDGPTKSGEEQSKFQVEHPVQTTPGKLSAKDTAAGVFLVTIAVLGLFINQDVR